MVTPGRRRFQSPAIDAKTEIIGSSAPRPLEIGIVMTWLPPTSAYLPDDRTPSTGRYQRQDGNIAPLATSSSFFAMTGLAGERQSCRDPRDAERDPAEERELAAADVPAEVVKSIRDGDWTAIKTYIMGLSKELNSLVGVLVGLQIPDRPVKLLTTSAAAAAELSKAISTAVRLDKTLRSRRTSRAEAFRALREIVGMAKARAAQEGSRRVGSVKKLLYPAQRCLVSLRKF
jgi:hypothetical protein